MAETFFQISELPDLQKSENGVIFPAVLYPTTKLVNTCQLSQMIEAIQTHKPWLESLLQKNGAILLRGFPITTASEFNEVVEAFGFPEMPYLGGTAMRTQVVGRVFTANESPPQLRIHFHHEMAYATNYPNKLFFFCEVEPGNGGETAIVPSHIIYDRMKEKYPEFVQELEEHGVIYARLMAEEDDIMNQIGRGWKSTFSTHDKNIAEQRAEKLGMKLEWLGNAVIQKMDAVPAIKYDEVNQRKTWFNSLAGFYYINKDVKICDPNKLLSLGNNKPVPNSIIHDCMKILDAESVSVPWQKGDILLLNNLTVSHSRMPLISPPRRILVAMCK